MTILQWFSGRVRKAIEAFFFLFHMELKETEVKQSIDCALV